MAELFRKSSLEKLSSPEQLDKMIVITPLSFWIALSGAGFIIITALIWSIFGSLPVNVETQGIYVNREGTYKVYSEVAGIVQEVAVQEKDVIKKGDVIAYLNSDEIRKQIDDFDRRIAMVEDITMDSTDDVVTADNRSLIDVKNQKLTVDQSLLQSQAMLKLRTENVATQRTIAAEAERKMREAEGVYYANLNPGDSTDEQLAYSEAQSALANASGYLESAYGGLDQANVALVRAQKQYDKLNSDYTKLLAACNADYSVQENTVIDFYNSNVTDASSNPITNDILDALQSKNYDAVPDLSTNTTWIGYVNNYSDAYIAAMNIYGEDIAKADSTLKQYETEINAAQSTKDNYQSSVSKYKAQKDDAEDDYDSAKDRYLSQIEAMGNAQGNSTKQNNAYNIALSTYNNEKAKLDSAIDAMEQTAAQVESDRAIVEKQTSALYSQFAATKASVIDQLTRERESYEKQKEKCAITSTVDGTISNVALIPGGAVNQGSEVISVVQGDLEDNVVVCYVPLSAGKKVVEGMKVLIYPTTVNKQEYGHMVSTVESVDSYVTSTETLQKQLGNSNLVESFMQSGPVVATVCRLQEDKTTSSGYYWSSKKGAKLNIEEGTLVEANIVVEEKAPITMLIPYLKEKLTVKAKSESESNT